MYLLDNPVLQRELLVNLRMVRAFVLLFAYVALLGVVVYVAWPSERRLDLTDEPPEAERLVNMSFLGQYVLMSLMVPSFAAGTITGEKERKTYEMLLASPMRPGAIVLGKLLASLAHLAVLVFCTLPIVMLCLPLGGVSLYEVLGTYAAMAASVVTFSMISLAASSYFSRSIAAQMVSYLIILPLALAGVLFYRASAEAGHFRLVVVAGVFPAICLVVSGLLMATITARLLRPPDVGSEAQEVVDLDEEQREAVGMVIRSDQWPDKLFAPPKRTDLMSNQVNPVYEKEIRSELFGHGTLMLRLVIQLSMLLALVVMAVCLYIVPSLAPWYTSYVLLFNMLVGPVFSAGSVTNERERQTLEMLLTTTLSPWQILSGKLISSLRVSVVLTGFLVWPLLLAWLLPPWTFRYDSLTMLGYVAIIAVTSLTTTTLAMFCSVLCRKTSVSLMTAYLALILLFALPVAVKLFADVFRPAPASLVHHASAGYVEHEARFRLTGPTGRDRVIHVYPGSLGDVAVKINEYTDVTRVRADVAEDGKTLLIRNEEGANVAFVAADVLSGRFDVHTPSVLQMRHALFVSPFAASFSLPLHLGEEGDVLPQSSNWSPITVPAFLGFYLAVDLILILLMVSLFNARWRAVTR
jgi:ABC-type transport system involved in multi-copper enzyme maturation permease subunit